MVKSRGRTKVALLRLTLCYSVVSLRLALKPNPYEVRVRVSKSMSINQSVNQSVSLLPESHNLASASCMPKEQTISPHTGETNLGLADWFPYICSAYTKHQLQAHAKALTVDN